MHLRLAKRLRFGEKLQKADTNLTTELILNLNACVHL